MRPRRQHMKGTGGRFSNAYLVVCYPISLRGCEGFLLDLVGLNRKFDVGGAHSVVLALLGKIKGESGDRAHI
jgi:hypothetical protein